MIYSKVRIEFSEQITAGEAVFNTFARESGTQGENRLGGDLGDAIKLCPRPLQVLAEAIVHLYDGYPPEKPNPLLQAAKEYVAKWATFDSNVAWGTDPLELAYPG